MLKYVDEKDFKNTVIESKRVTVVDFFATWCPPCKMLSEVLENVSKSRAEFDIVKIDVDKNANLAQEYKVAVVPTIVLFKNGEVVKRVEGYLSENELAELVAEYID